ERESGQPHAGHAGALQELASIHAVSRRVMMSVGWHPGSPFLFRPCRGNADVGPGGAQELGPVENFRPPCLGWGRMSRRSSHQQRPRSTEERTFDNNLEARGFREECL